MIISESEQKKLNSILTETQLYARAKQQVLETLSSKVQGSSRPMENLAIDLAIEKGAKMAFETLESLTKAQPKIAQPVLPRTILKRKETTNE